MYFEEQRKILRSLEDLAVRQMRAAANLYDACALISGEDRYGEIDEFTKDSYTVFTKGQYRMRVIELRDRYFLAMSEEEKELWKKLLELYK